MDIEIRSTETILFTKSIDPIKSIECAVWLLDQKNGFRIWAYYSPSDEHHLICSVSDIQQCLEYLRQYVDDLKSRRYFFSTDDAARGYRSIMDLTSQEKLEDYIWTWIPEQDSMCNPRLSQNKRTPIEPSTGIHLLI